MKVNQIQDMRSERVKLYIPFLNKVSLPKIIKIREDVKSCTVSTNICDDVFVMLTK